MAALLDAIDNLISLGPKANNLLDNIAAAPRGRVFLLASVKLDKLS